MVEHAIVAVLGALAAGLGAWGVIGWQRVALLTREREQARGQRMATREAIARLLHFE